MAISLALAVAMTRNLLLAPGLIGLRHDWPIPAYPGQLLQWLGEHFSMWSVRSLGNRYNLYGLPWTTVALTVPAFLGMDGADASRLLLLGSIATSGLSLSFLTRTLGIPRRWALAASLFYMVTPVFFEKIASGYIHYLVSYALQPAALGLFIRAVPRGAQTHSQRRDLVLTGVVTAMTWYQPQFVALLPLELGLWTAFQYRTPVFRPSLRALLLTLLIAVGVNATLVTSGLVIALDSFDTTATPVGQTVGYWTVYASRSTNLAGSLVLVDATFSYFFRTVSLNPLFPLWAAATLALFTMVYIGATLRLRLGPCRRLTLYFLALCAISAWFGKGLGEPLGDATFFLFVHLPPFQVFREFGHILGMGALGTSGLLALSLETLHGLWGQSRFRHWMQRLLRWPSSSRRPRVVLRPGASAVGLAVVLIGIYGWPMLTGDFAGNVQAFSLAPDMEGLYDRLARDPGDYRVLWIPMVQPVTYPGARYAGNDPIQLSSPKSTFHPGFPVNGALGPYTQFVGSTLHENRTSYLGDLLSLASTRYVLYRHGPRTAFQNFSVMGIMDRAAYDRYANESDTIPPMLEGQKDLEEDPSFNLPSVRVWTNEQWLPHAYIADRVFLVAGDLSTLVSLAYARELGETSDFLGSRPAFLFLSQLPPISDLKGLLDRVDGVIVDGDHLEDLALALVPSEDRVVFDHLENYADLTRPALDRWARVQQHWFWRDWHYTASLDDPAMAVHLSPLRLVIPPDRAGTWDVNFKGYEGPRSAPLDLYRGGGFLRKIYMNGSAVQSRWFGLGQLYFDPGNLTLTISSRAGVEDNRLVDPSFEEGWDASALAPVSWTLRQGNVTLDPSLAFEGDFSVRLTTPPGQPSSALAGSPVAVLGGGRYIVGAWMKVINGQAAGVAVEGYDSQGGRWKTLATLSPNATQGTAGHLQDMILRLPDGISLLRPVVMAGTPRNTSRGEAVAWFDQVTVKPDLSDSVLSRVALVRPGSLDAARSELAHLLGGRPFLYLRDLGSEKVGTAASDGEVAPIGPGGHVMITPGGLPPVPLRILVRSTGGNGSFSAASGQSIVALSPRTEAPGWSNGSLAVPDQGGELFLGNTQETVVPLDLVVALSADRRPLPAVSTVEDGHPLDPSRYTLVVRGEGRKFIVYNEAFDRWWRATVGERQIEPLMVNGGMMGFWLDPSDGGTVVLEFLPQRAYQVGVTIAVLTLLTAAAFVAMAHPRVRRWWLSGQRAVLAFIHRGSGPR